MCGIVGKLNLVPSPAASSMLLEAMLATIRHRGPDEEGIYISAPVALGHCRLSIIDLTSGGQPLCNEDRTVWIVFNGEIYNYVELRHDLLSKGHVFRTQTDTEVIVHLYEERGAACIEKLRGMFAFALWDDRRRQLLLARDRVGIKPLYYRLTSRSLVFASEIKAILADPEATPEVSPEIVHRFLTFYYLPGEDTLLRNIRKLPPGSYMVVNNGRADIHRYWDLDFTTEPRSLPEAERELSRLVEESVRLHMVSDVPVGLLLSGGIDSTAMLGFAAGASSRPLSTFTIGFSAPGMPDERHYAGIAARAYGTEHYETTISAREFQDSLPTCVWHMEEPVCEAPAVALYYVSGLAAGRVKVLLSGEGGDEAFAGYPEYRTIVWIEKLKRLFAGAQDLLYGGARLANVLLRSERLARYAPLFQLPFAAYYYSRTSNPFRVFNSGANRLYTRAFLACRDKERAAAPVAAFLAHAAGYDPLSKTLYVDTHTWLPDDLLLKADKMTMANSVELRVPLLDHKVLEFAASLPAEYKLHRFASKYIWKRALRDRLPVAVWRRSKAGFPIPYSTWLRSELRPWITDLLLDTGTLARGYFEKNAIQELLAEHAQSGRYAKELFSLAVLELWQRQFLRPARTVGRFESAREARVNIATNSAA